MAPSWPRCEHSIELLFEGETSCVLPLGHQLDGELWHRDEDDVHWIEIERVRIDA